MITVLVSFYSLCLKLIRPYLITALSTILTLLPCKPSFQKQLCYVIFIFVGFICHQIKQFWIKYLKEKSLFLSSRHLEYLPVWDFLWMCQHWLPKFCHSIPMLAHHHDQLSSWFQVKFIISDTSSWESDSGIKSDKFSSFFTHISYPFFVLHQFQWILKNITAFTARYHDCL